MQEYSMVIVVHISDLELLKKHIQVIYHFLKPKEIIIISHKDAVQNIGKMRLGYTKFIDEDNVAPGLNYKAVKETILKRYPYAQRFGWYFQQFLKMAYANICEEKWYLVWDADTIPLKNIVFFNRKGKGILDVKSEYHKPYFRTIKKLLGIDKKIKYSFISEHMLVCRDVMMDMLHQIENNSELQGESFFQKIIYATNISDLRRGGFSEYETYGSFVMEKYPKLYVIRKLRTLREGKILLGNNVNRKMLKWAGASYDIVSFEKYHQTSIVARICSGSFLRYFISMKRLWHIYKKVYGGNYYE